MAIKLDREFKKVPVKGAYLRVDWYRFDQPSRVGYGIGMYASESAAKDAEGNSITENRIGPTIDVETTVAEFGGKSGVTLAGVYAHIKKQEAFKTATDC